MGRHSQNNTARGFHSRGEKDRARRDTGWGTQRLRLGTDMQLPFGHCCLSLHPVEEPVVSPSGHLYSKECIYEYMLTKIKELKRQRAAFDAQQAEVSKQQQDDAASQERRRLEDFAQSQEGILSRSALSASAGPSKASVESALSSKVDLETRAQKRKDFERINTWLPEFTPSAAAAPLKAPSKRPRSPMSGEPLRLKDLIPIDLVTSSGSKPGDAGRYLCAVSKKEINHQEVVVIKRTGQMMTKECYERLARPTMTCPITGKQFKASDVLELKSAGSGFASKGGREAKRYRPNL